MRLLPARLSLTIWLLAGTLLVSLALNVYCLTPRPLDLAARLATTAEAADDWDDEDEDNDDDQPLTPSRAMLADELRRARLQLSRCQASHAAQATPPKTAAHAHPCPHG